MLKETPQQKPPLGLKYTQTYTPILSDFLNGGRLNKFTKFVIDCQESSVLGIDSAMAVKTLDLHG